MTENLDTQTNIPAGWFLSEDKGLPYNPFLTSPKINTDEIIPHIPGTPWLTETDILDLVGYKPDTIFCYTGSVKQPVINTSGDLEPPLSADREFRYGAASFAYGQDPYRKDIQGTGGKANVIATMHLTEPLPEEIPIYTLATYDNKQEELMAQKQGMPTAAAVYEHELRRFGVTNPVIRLEDPGMKGTFKLVLASIMAAAKNPGSKDIAVVTLRYHIPRCAAFFDVCGLGEEQQIDQRIFNNWYARSKEQLLTPGLQEAVAQLNSRGVRFKVLGAENVMDRVDANRMAAGKSPKYRTVLNYVYPPKLTLEQFKAMPKDKQELWLKCVNDFEARQTLEMQGVQDIKQGIYFQEKKS